MLEPECYLGYTDKQLEELLIGRLDEWHEWSIGITRAICDGRTYDYETMKYVPSECGPHGVITYVYDVEEFLADGENND